MITKNHITVIVIKDEIIAEDIRKTVLEEF